MTLGARRRRLALTALLVVLAACARPTGTSQPSASALPADQTTSTPLERPTPEPLPSVRIVFETPAPQRRSLQHEVIVLLTERFGGGPCSFLGSATLTLDPEELEADVAALPPDGGWIEAPWLWAGNREALRAALGREILVEDEGEFWVLTEINSFAAGHQYVRWTTAGSLEIWVAKDTAGPMPPGQCPPEEPSGSFVPQATIDPAVVDLGLTVQEFADAWNSQRPPEALVIREVTVSGGAGGSSATFSAEFPMGHVIGLAWTDDRVYAVDVNGEWYFDDNDNRNQQLTAVAFETLLHALHAHDPSKADHLGERLGISTLGEPLRPDGCADTTDETVDLEGVRYLLRGVCSAWSLHIDDLDNPYP